MAYTDKMYWEICTDETDVLMIEYNEFESIRVQNKDNWNNDGTSRGYMAYFCQLKTMETKFIERSEQY